MCNACYVPNWSQKAAVDTWQESRRRSMDKEKKKILTLWWQYSDALLMFIFSFEVISKLYPKSKKGIYSIICEYFLFSAIPRLGNGSSWADLDSSDEISTTIWVWPY